jgi:hypothetical protein
LSTPIAAFNSGSGVMARPCTTMVCTRRPNAAPSSPNRWRSEVRLAAWLLACTTAATLTVSASAASR